MKPQLSNRILQLQESASVAMASRSRALQAEGIDIINLSIGELDFNTPAYIKAAGKTAIDENYTHYPPVAGYLPLRQAIAHKLMRDSHVEYSPEQIVVSGGAKQSITNVFQCLLNPDDEVIIPAPYWLSYADMARLAGAKPIIIPTTIEQDFKVLPQQIKATISPNTKAIIFSSPCNPSGSVYSRQELKAIAELMQTYPYISIISDEIYEHILFEGERASIAQFSEVKEQVIIINGVSKSFAMTGWRLGFMAAPLALAQACTKLQGQTTSGTNTIAQRAAIVAFNTPFSQDEESQTMLKALKLRRDSFVEWISQIEGFKCNVPKGAFYLFPNVEAFFGKTDGETIIQNATDFVMYLLNKAHVACVTGEACGDANCIRFSYASSLSTLKEAAQRIQKACEQLK